MTIMNSDNLRYDYLLKLFNPFQPGICTIKCNFATDSGLFLLELYKLCAKLRF